MRVLIIDSILDLIYPLRCSFCKDIIKRGARYFLCDKCQKEIKFITNSCRVCGKSLTIGYEGICADCRMHKHHFDRCISVVEYKDLVKYALIRYKFFGKKELSNTFLELIADKAKEFTDADIIIGVPIHISRYRERGFNQSQILAKELSKKMNITCEEVLVKVKNTRNQSSLSRENRLKNLKGAFEVLDIAKITNKNILLIDDIYTTGATVSECANTLKKAGAQKIYILTVASGKGY